MPTIDFRETYIESCLNVGKSIYLEGNPHHDAVKPMRENNDTYTRATYAQSPSPLPCNTL